MQKFKTNDKKQLELINAYSNVAEYNVNTQKSIVFLKLAINKLNMKFRIHHHIGTIQNQNT